MDKIPIMKLEPGKVPHVEAWAIIASDLAGRAMPQLVEKSWGYELIYINTDEYCCKLLHFDKGSTSMHFHVRKHETLVVTKGTLLVEYIVNKEHKKIYVPEKCALVVPPGFPHKLSATSETEVVEASTYDDPSDSIRISN